MDKAVTYTHQTVLLKETADPLVAMGGGIFLDCTLGGGGHTAYLLENNPEAKVVAVDKDREMLERANTRFREYLTSGRLKLVHADFRKIAKDWREHAPAGFQGIMADFGVSSFQLDQPGRGFSFMNNGPLDMRMDNSAPFSAYDFINESDEKTLADTIWKYGEEKNSRRIARAILEARKQQPIADTQSLVEIISACQPRPKGKSTIHPATRTFQAIRIAVNGEIEAIEELLSALPDILAPGGVFCAISFHSLEDRPVKERLKFLTDACICPPQILTCERCQKPPGRLGCKKPISPTESEVRRNSRARSAKLRIFYRMGHEQK
jgi:16S rRNA (cytosine1402-N4)-methyltransferase